MDISAQGNSERKFIAACITVMLAAVIPLFCSAFFVYCGRCVAARMQSSDTIAQLPLEPTAGQEPLHLPAAPLIKKMRVTAYCSCQKCCGKWAKFKTTASGHKINEGDVFAAADRAIPFGTEIIVPGYACNLAVQVLDRGGAIKGDRIDIYFDTHDEALEWGVRELDVTIFSPGSRLLAAAGK